MTEITIPSIGLVLMVGASGSGKSRLAARRFHPSEIVELDRCREIVSGDRNDQSATDDAAAVAAEIIERRLRRRLLTVVDATNVRSEDRRRWTSIAARTHSLVTAIVLDPGMGFCQKSAEARDGERYNPRSVAQHYSLLSRDRRKLSKSDGVRNVTTLSSPEEIEAATIRRRDTYNDKRSVTGPFDIIGDVHGMTDELETLLEKLGWSVVWTGEGEERMSVLSHREDRRLVFLGDMTDRGPRSRDALLIMEAAVSSGQGFAVASNHDDRFKRWLQGRETSLTHGIDTSIADFEGTSETYRRRIADVIDALPAHLVFDGGRLAVAHVGLREDMILGASPEMRDFAVFGPKSAPGEDGKSARVDWADEYRGRTSIVYGHTVVDEPVWHNRTICLDTGAVFGGSLTALRWPEKEIVSVPASKAYAELDRPAFSRKEIRDPAVIGFKDVSGKKYVETGLSGRITVEADHMAGALEHMSRYAIDPRWLVYIPPTMSPVESSSDGDYLEHPAQAFDYYRKHGVTDLVVETKHMGSRALALVCRDAETAARRFGVEDGHTGHVWSRSGRAFFDEDQRRTVVAAISDGASRGLFDELRTDWLLLDMEIMPWNTKATDLIERQFAPTGRAAQMGGRLALHALSRFASRGVADVSALQERLSRRLENAGRFDAVWRGYCWDAPDLSALRIAPFHVLASEGRVHHDVRHDEHLRWIEMLAGSGMSGMLVGTPHLRVDLSDETTVAAAVDLWVRDTSSGAEGIVVKPHTFATRGERGLVQPALKVRGRDYLRIIYGPDYDLPENLARLRDRAIASKRGRAMKQFALGVEGLERLVRREPVRRVHECVFSTIALDSDPLDPRL